MRTVLQRSGLSRSFFIVALLLVAASMASPAASAQHPAHRGANQWHGDLGRFHQHDWQVWRGGHWTHAHHEHESGFDAALPERQGSGARWQ